MAGAIALIEKYKARLDPQNEFKKIFRALQKLNEIDMTVSLLLETGVGRAVHKLRKEKGLGEFAREIVSKWKNIAAIGDKTDHKPRSDVAYSSRVKSEPVEYDPASNWNAPTSNDYSTNSYRPARSVKQETIEEDEYDPSRNWQMEGVQSESNTPEYQPSSSPVRVKEEKVSPKQKKKHKNKEHGSSRMTREVRSETQHSPAKMASKVKDKHRHPAVKIECVVSPPRHAEPEIPSEEEVEEYDPSNNYELSNGSPEGYDPESDHENHEEYQPGPSNGSYQPSSSQNNRVQSDAENDSERSYEEDEPGAYLLHPRKASGEFSHHSNQDSDAEESASDSFVHSTTLYSRNKSVDSEDGMWGSRVNARKENMKANILSKKSNSKKSVTETEKSDSRTKVVKQKKPKIKTEKLVETAKTSKSQEKSKKRRLGDNPKNEPPKKKLKPVKAERSEVREASFLFENIPDVPKSVKKKKHKTKPTSSKQPTVTSETAEPKLNLHLPKIQATYRPLPQVESNWLKHNETALTDNQAAELHSKRQTKKMLVYSGGSGGFIPKMMSLYDQCMTILMNNIDAIDSFGGIPFEIVQPILKKCTPEQLYKLEDFNPYLLEDTDYLWQEHCKMEFRSNIPDEMESWREMYLRLSDEREAKLASLTHMISLKEAKKKPLEKKVMLAYVGANAKPPRSVRRAQEKYGTAVRSRPSSNMTSQSTSAIRRDLVESRMSVPVGSITAASVDREHRVHQISQMKKPRIAPMMAKTLKSIGKTRFRR